MLRSTEISDIDDVFVSFMLEFMEEWRLQNWTKYVGYNRTVNFKVCYENGLGYVLLWNSYLRAIRGEMSHV